MPTIILSPSAILCSKRVVESHFSGQVLTLGSGTPLDPLQPGETLVGYVHYTGGAQWLNAFFRGLVKFDLSQLPGTPHRATLTFRVSHGALSFGGYADFGTRITMLRQLLRANEDWTHGTHSFIEGPLFAEMPASGVLQPGDYSAYGGQVMIHVDSSETTYTIDVTMPVAEWRQGERPNNGFVLVGAAEPVKEDDDYCVTSYKDFTLEVLSRDPLPPAASDLACYQSQKGAKENVVYRGTDDWLYQLWVEPGEGWFYRNLSQEANLPRLAGDASGYALPDDTQIVVCRDIQGTLYQLSLRPGAHWHADNLKVLASAPPAAGDPFAYCLRDGTRCVVYRATDNCIHHLWLSPEPDAEWGCDNITADNDLPYAAGDPMAYLLSNFTTPTQCVVYRTTPGAVYHLWSEQVAHGWHPTDLTRTVRAPGAAGDPFGYILHGGWQRVLYRTFDRKVGQLQGGVAGATNWIYDDLSQRAGVLAGISGARVGGDPVACVGFTGDQSVLYRSLDEHLYQLLQDRNNRWQPADVTASAPDPWSDPIPRIAGNPSAFVNGSGVQQVYCRDAAGTLYRIQGVAKWDCEKITHALPAD